MNSTNKAILLILDGWGYGNKDHSDAIYNAKTPFVDHLYKNTPYSFLKTFGENVGLPEGQMGNSEVGHMNIGAGRIVWQMLVRINKAFKENKVRELKAFKSMVDLAKSNPNRKIHLMGLVSDGGVHSSMDHLIELTALLKQESLDNRSYIHAFTDGRDTDPHSALTYLKTIQQSDALGSCKIASLCGRYFAMDRDKRWERTSKAYNLMVHGHGKVAKNIDEAIEASYNDGITDEFIEPTLLNNSEDFQPIQPDDIVLCFNFRTDRARQIITALTQKDLPDFNMKTLDLHCFTMTRYDKSYEGIKVLFDDHDLINTLGEVLANLNKTQLRAAETEKYPHVTFFFNGGREQNFKGEDRIMVNSPKVATYDLQPEMSAPELTEKVDNAIRENLYDFVCVNFANPDMVGHTGVYEAITKACEVVDFCTKTLVTTAKSLGYNIVIIADHGNADFAVNPDGSPNTAHSTNLVPCFVISSKVSKTADGVLADVAPTVLQLMELSQPKEMTGSSIILK